MQTYSEDNQSNSLEEEDKREETHVQDNELNYIDLMKNNTREKEVKDERESICHEDSNVINFKIKGQNDDNINDKDSYDKTTSVYVHGNLLEPFSLHKNNLSLKNYNSEQPLLLDDDKNTQKVIEIVEQTNNHPNDDNSKKEYISISNNYKNNSSKSSSINNLDPKSEKNDNLSINSSKIKIDQDHNSQEFKSAVNDKAYKTIRESSSQSENLKMVDYPSNIENKQFPDSSVANHFRNNSVQSDNNSKSEFKKCSSNKFYISNIQNNDKRINSLDINNNTEFDRNMIIGAKIHYNQNLEPEKFKSSNSLLQNQNIKLEPLIAKSNSEVKQLKMIKQQSNQISSNKQSPKHNQNSLQIKP